MPGPPVRVVVVEDSVPQRRLLVRLLEEGGTIAVVGEAGSTGEAVRVVAAATPDVVTMDLELPGGTGDTPGGIAAIAAIMAARAVPILVLSAHLGAGDTVAIEALAAGAVDCLPKDADWSPASASALRRRVAVLSRLQMVQRPRRPAGEQPTMGHAGPVVALAASTGGPSALRTVLAGLADVPAPILLVQHIHADFARSFAAWLQQTTGLPATLAEHGQLAVDGHVHIAPPHVHLHLGPGRRLELHREPDLISRPSCDELLRSVARTAGPWGIGAVLTGMGDDGARGLLALRERGGTTFAQDGPSAVVDGMPRAARELGAAERTVALDGLGAAIAAAARRRAPR